jgi:tetratricopeptide (TPR) repeat protein
MFRQQAQKRLPPGFVFAEEDFGDCGHWETCSIVVRKAGAPLRSSHPRVTKTPMFDAIPTRVWLLIAIGAVAFAPARYVIRHIAHSPERRDITQPPEDLSWRSTGQLARSLAVLVIAAALALFIFTPAASEFAHSDWFVPTLCAAFAVFALFSVVEGFRKGHIEPLTRGFSRTYERTKQPKRFWASLCWNGLVAGGFLWLAFVIVWRLPDDRCLNSDGAEAAQAKLSACTELLARADTTDEQADILAEQGIAYYWLDDYTNAAKVYSRAIEFDPKDSYSLYNRGLAYEALGRPDKALSDFSASLALRPDNADGYLERGGILLNFGDFDGAIADFTRAHEREPDKAPPLANRGLAYAWKGDRALAAADFAAVKKIDPSNTVLLHGEAVLYLKKHDLVKAVTLFTEALRKNPNDRWALRMRADAYWDMGELDKARDDDDRLVELKNGAGNIRRDSGESG